MGFCYNSTTVLFHCGTVIFKQLRRRQETVSTDDANYTPMQQDDIAHDYNLIAKIFIPVWKVEETDQIKLKSSHLIPKKTVIVLFWKKMTLNVV